MIQHAGNSVKAFGKDQTNSVTYCFNQQGFRGPNFDFQPDYAFFGCSLVFGIGIEQQETFAYQFENSQNYGLAGNYTNDDTMTIIEKFLHSDLYKPRVKMAVVWKSQNIDDLNDFYNKIQDQEIFHFFCGNPLKQKNCHAMPPNLDLDVSNTHPGVASHRYLWKILQSLFRL